MYRPVWGTFRFLIVVMTLCHGVRSLHRGFAPRSGLVSRASLYSSSANQETINLRSNEEFQRHKHRPVNEIYVEADTSMINDRQRHPVVEVVIDRWKMMSKPGKRDRNDFAKVALAIEGGGMRGCVSAGATAALQFLGLADAVDIVYGSSAGSMVGAYFVTRQTGGMGIYHDILPAAGNDFIDKKKLLKTLVTPSFVSMEGRESNVFNLDFLLEGVMASTQPLDWDTFSSNQKVQPLKIVASSIRSFEPVVMSHSNGDFIDLAGMLKCIRSSMGVPGITGGLMARATAPLSEGVSGDHAPPRHPFALGERDSSEHGYTFAPMLREARSKLSGKKKMVKAERKGAPVPEHWLVEPLVDALVAEPIPYRSAVKDGATHVIALRTRPDPSPILGKPAGVYEKVISRRFFARYAEPEAAEFLLRSDHHKIYAEDLVILNDAATGPSDGVKVKESDENVHLLPIAPAEGRPEVGQLEMKRVKLLEGMRDGARRTFEIFYPSIQDHYRDKGEDNHGFVDVETMVDQLFPLDAPNPHISEWLLTETLQQGHTHQIL